MKRIIVFVGVLAAAVAVVSTMVAQPLPRRITIGRHKDCARIEPVAVECDTENIVLVLGAAGLVTWEDVEP